MKYSIRERVIVAAEEGHYSENTNTLTAGTLALHCGEEKPARLRHAVRTRHPGLPLSNLPSSTRNPSAWRRSMAGRVIRILDTEFRPAEGSSPEGRPRRV